MKIMRPSYYEYHNYSNRINSGWWEAVKPYVVIFLLTTFWVYSFMAAAHWGQNHCHKHIKILKHKSKVKKKWTN